MLLITTRQVKRLLLLRLSSNETLAFQLERWAARRPDRPFLLYGERAYSYAQANAAINRHAHAYRALGVGRGDVVALMMENRPEHLFHVFGLHKLGAVVSLINTHIVGDGLAHAIRACEPKRIVVGSELWPSFAEVERQLAELGRGMTHIDLDCEHPLQSVREPAPTFNALLERAAESNPDSTGQQQLRDLAAFIYTSGTTGKPKAALVRHERLYRAGAAWSGVAIRYRRSDVMYNCLPLYHANGLLLATGSVITAGATMALARRFSRQRFWDDVRRYRATSFIYIGELCRYLMNNPPSERDRDHEVRVVSGNGLRPDIWRAFQRRFGIRRVAEFYGATEGNCITLNFANFVGSVGPKLPGMALAKWDEAAQGFVRNERGFLVKAKTGQPGILLGRIHAGGYFDGYRDKRDTESKVLRDVFKRGDAYFNTGDLLKTDAWWHLYFTDRVGDTFRWKGENVSTTEVQEQISKWPLAAEVNVYGVQVPGIEGRAGMAAIVVTNGHGFDAGSFQAHVDANLPSYARPLFVRLQDKLEMTGTFKMKKADLQKEGFDPSAVADPIYFRHPAKDEYVRLEPALHAELSAGKLKL
jgi:acyl-CoA synthetase (AMP-forming)/AMP-acid ligase II